jgi:glycosyltransferase involved in cell wall biosynthesis
MSTVSVVIATIPPRAELLERAKRSVYAQRRPPDEIVIELDRFGRGAGPTRNRAFRRATSEYVAVLDDDDELLPRHLHLLMLAAEWTAADVVYSWFELWEDGRQIVDRELATMWHGQLVHPLGIPFGPEQEAHMRRYAYIPACLLLRRDLALEVGGYPGPDEADYHDRDGCEDWALLIRLLDAGARFHHVPERTWRLHKGAGTAGRPWRDDLRTTGRPRGTS